MEKLMQILTTHFKPEFLNRVDETVVFHPLSRENIKSIAGIQLQTLKQRLNANGYEVEFADHLLGRIADIGFDPIYGARPLRRAIQNSIEDPLSELVLSGKLMPNQRVELDLDDAGRLNMRTL